MIHRCLGGGFAVERFALGHAVDVRHVVYLLDLTVFALLANHRFAGLQRGIHDGLRIERHDFGSCLLPMRHTLYAQYGLRTLLADAYLVFLAYGNAFGIKNRCRRQFAVGGLGAFAVGYYRDRPFLVDHHAAGELLVHVVDIDGDGGGLAFVRLEEADQLVGAVRNRPEGNVLAIDGHSGLIGVAHGDNRMIGQRAARRGLYDIVRPDGDMLFLQQSLDAHGICGHGCGLAIDVQRHGLTCAQSERRHSHRAHRDHADGNADATQHHKTLRCPSPCHTNLFPDSPPVAYRAY